MIKETYIVRTLDIMTPKWYNGYYINEGGPLRTWNGNVGSAIRRSMLQERIKCIVTPTVDQRLSMNGSLSTGRVNRLMSHVSNVGLYSKQQIKESVSAQLSANGSSPMHKEKQPRNNYASAPFALKNLGQCKNVELVENIAPHNAGIKQHIEETRVEIESLANLNQEKDSTWMETGGLPSKEISSPVSNVEDSCMCLNGQGRKDSSSTIKMEAVRLQTRITHYLTSQPFANNVTIFTTIFHWFRQMVTTSSKETFSQNLALPRSRWCLSGGGFLDNLPTPSNHSRRR